MTRTEAFEKVEIQQPNALWDWLEEHHAQDSSIWLVTWKAAHRDRYVSRDQVLDALITYGWIDGIRRKLDDDRTMQLISPRKQQVWAETYKQRAARLVEEGRMMPSGLAAVETAKTAGTWNALDHVDALFVPEDLKNALSGPASSWFEAAAPSYRRNVLRWIAGAKKSGTRAKRVSIVAAYAAQGKRVPNY